MLLSRPFVPTIVLLAMPVAAPAADPFEFKDGDRVVLIGSTLIEREQKYGFWELFLTLKNNGKRVTFRNLGWSGDTVHAEARGRFDYANPAKCLDQLVSLTKELKPTLIVICYGHNESFEGKAGVPKFTKGLEKLLDELKPTNARIVLMSPTPFDSTLPKERNADLALYRDAMKEVVEKRELELVDLLEKTMLWDVARDSAGPAQLTDNGVHLTPNGYLVTARLLTQSMTVSAETEPLRNAIIAKNRLFFHRWRPQNETYLFGFRKHEQGKNAAEVAEFDPLVAEAEKKIQTLVDKLK